MRFHRGLYVVLERPVFRVSNVANAQELLHLQPAIIGDRNVAMLFVDNKVTRQLRRLAGSDLELFAFFQL